MLFCFYNNKRKEIRWLETLILQIPFEMGLCCKQTYKPQVPMKKEFLRQKIDTAGKALTLQHQSNIRYFQTTNQFIEIVYLLCLASHIHNFLP